MANSEFDNLDARLLDIVQRDFPLTARPFEAIAARLGVSSAKVMDRLRRLKTERIIRQISAIFDSKALGYTSALVAFKVRIDALEKVAGVVSSHDGVSHCYSRDAEFNLWFTITLPPQVDQRREIELLACAEGVDSHLILPALRVFKIGVFLDIGESRRRGVGEDAAGTVSSPIARVLTQDDRAAVRALQKDLPIVEEPFAQLADEVGVSGDELLLRAQDLWSCGVMRRFAAVLRHQRAGYTWNAMVCWAVAPEQIEATGEAFASHPAVSHCYERPASAQWPYPLYTMIHARDDEELRRIIGDLSGMSGPAEFRVLRSVKEYKKSRVVYFE